MTTPYGSRAEGECPDTGVSSHTDSSVHAHERDLAASAIHALHGTILEHGSTFTLCPKPANPPKGYLVENVQKNYVRILVQGAKNGECFPPAGGAASIPRSLRPGKFAQSGKLLTIMASTGRFRYVTLPIEWNRYEETCSI